MSAHLGSDELETGELSPCLILDDLGDLGVSLGEVGIKTGVLQEPRGHSVSYHPDDQDQTRLTKSVGTGTEATILTGVLSDVFSVDEVIDLRPFRASIQAD